MKGQILLRPVILFVAPVLLAGCAGFSEAESSGRMGSDSPRAEVEVYEEWTEIYTVEVKGGASERTHRGYLKHRFTRGESGEHYVYDLKHEPLGFVSPMGKAYRFERNRSGEIVNTEIAHEGLEKGVLKLLGVMGSVEFAEISEEDLKRKE